MRQLNRDQLTISLGSTSLGTDPIRFNGSVSPNNDDRCGSAQLGHDLITEIIPRDECCVPPRCPALSLQHRCELKCQRPICFGVADEDICHGRPMAQGYSITSSALASSVGGTLRPSVFAVLMLMTNSNLVGCSTGSSAGFAPFIILST